MVLDYLQTYDYKKKSDHTYKHLFLGKEVYNTFSVEPGYYSNKF